MIRWREDMKFAWKLGFHEIENGMILESEMAGFDKNGYENECIIIRK